MIDRVQSKYDLSRRVTLYPMHGFSFREYLEYYEDIPAPVISLNELLFKHTSLTNKIDSTLILKYFRKYLQIGYYPFTKILEHQTECFQAIENIVQKTIYEDIASLHNLKTPTLMLIEKIYKYVLSTPAGELNTNKLSQRLQKDYNDISRYLTYLNQAGLIHFIHSQKMGNAAFRHPTKILPDNTNMIFSNYLPQIQDNIAGKVREVFFENQIKNAGYPIIYSNIGDYQVDQYLFEIGGKNKTQKQLKGKENAFILADSITQGFENKIPLYLVGFLY